MSTLKGEALRRALAVRCPECGAAPDEGCSGISGWPHEKRYKAAEEARP